MSKITLLNEIKFIELKLHALKAQIESKETQPEAPASDSLYGILQGGDDITAEDIDAVKIKLKELT